MQDVGGTMVGHVPFISRTGLQFHAVFYFSFASFTCGKCASDLPEQRC